MSLAVAYGTKKHAAKKMAHGGEVMNEKLHPTHEPDHVSDIVEAIMKRGKPMAHGGMVEDESGHEMEAMSDAHDDFLADGHQTELAEQHYPEGMNESEDGADIMEGKRKKILGSILDGIMR